MRSASSTFGNSTYPSRSYCAFAELIMVIAALSSLVLRLFLPDRVVPIIPDETEVTRSAGSDSGWPIFCSQAVISILWYTLSISCLDRRSAFAEDTQDAASATKTLRLCSCAHPPALRRAAHVCPRGSGGAHDRPADGMSLRRHGMMAAGP